MSERNLPNYDTAWIFIITVFLVIYTNCSRPYHGCNQSRINAILKNIKGFYIFGEES